MTIIINLIIVYIDTGYFQKIVMTLKATPRISLMQRERTWLPQ